MTALRASARTMETCLDQEGSYACACSEGFHGKNCHLVVPDDHCASSPCENSGTCVNTADNNYICVCKPQWTGTNCEDW